MINMTVRQLQLEGWFNQNNKTTDGFSIKNGINILIGTGITQRKWRSSSQDYKNRRKKILYS